MDYIIAVFYLGTTVVDEVRLETKAEEQQMPSARKGTKNFIDKIMRIFLNFRLIWFSLMFDYFNL